jgi:ADP-ribosylation factor-like protein 6
MGLLDKISSLLSSKKKDANILIIGLDNGGKSSIINHLKNTDSKAISINPTVGFNVEKFTFKSLNLTTYDMSGQTRYRNLWEHYYGETDGIVFVVDSSDRMRIVVSKEELSSMLDHPVLKNRNVPILFFANKTDIKNSINSNDIRKELGLESIRNKSWHIFECSALNGNGIENGFEWFVEEIKNNSK